MKCMLCGQEVISNPNNTETRYYIGTEREMIIQHIIEIIKDANGIDKETLEKRIKELL